MSSASIHQTVHGYRDGHRLLSSSTPLPADASRALLVLSDLSGPSMQLGFEDYLTAYPLPGSDLFVFAKTWYASEMQRPGCVWTHSLLMSRELVSRFSTDQLLACLHRPRLEGVENSAISSIEVFDVARAPVEEDWADRSVSAALLGAVFGQARPVLVPVDTANQLELPLRRIWDVLWPTAKSRFSFCTGALMPRTVAGNLMDVQAVPRAVPTSQFRRIAGSAIVIDVRATQSSQHWAEKLLEEFERQDFAFRDWMERAVGAGVSLGAVMHFVPIFDQWKAARWSAQDTLASLVESSELGPTARAELARMVFERASSEAGPSARRELLQQLCSSREVTPERFESTLEEQTAQLFLESRTEGVALVVSLLGSTLTAVGGRVLQSAVGALVASDLDLFVDAQAPFLSTLAGANPSLAASPTLWRRAGGSAADVLAGLSAEWLGEKDRAVIVEAIFSADCDIPVDRFVNFGGKYAIFGALDAIDRGHLRLSWQWRSALSRQADMVLEWLEYQTTVTPHKLELCTKLTSPEKSSGRLVAIWEAGCSGAQALTPRVAAFGLALAFAHGNARSSLLSRCFEAVYYEASRTNLEYEAWDWLQRHASPVSRWREWDKCERLAAALARILERDDAALETVFRIVLSRQVMGSLTAVLEKDRNLRPYLNALRKAVRRAPGVGTSDQRDALLET